MNLKDITLLENLGASELSLVLTEAPHTSFKNNAIPDDLKFLSGSMVDLGFEDLKLTDDDFKAVQMAFVSTGVAIPGTKFKLIWKGGPRSAVEPIGVDEQIIALPHYWKEAVLVLGPNDELTWVGSMVRKARLEGFV